MTHPETIRPASWKLRKRKIQLTVYAATITVLGLGLFLGYDIWSLRPMKEKLPVFRALLTSAWWMVGILSLSMITSIVLLCGWTIVQWISPNRSDTDRTIPSSTTRPSSIDLRWVTLLQRYLLPAWFTLLMLWISLEAIGGLWLYLSHRTTLAAQPTTFTKSDTDELYVVGLGGSTTEGQPYHDRLSFPQITGWKLQKFYEGRRVIVNNLAEGGADLSRMHAYLQELERRPDAILIYSGHNEFSARFSVNSEVGPSVRRIWLPSFIGSVIRERYDRLSIATFPNRTPRKRFDGPAMTETDTENVYRDFEVFLDAILQFCRRHSITAVLVIPGSNEAGFGPNRSLLPKSVTNDTKDQLEAIYVKLDDPTTAAAEQLKLLNQACELAPEFAESWYQLGKRYEISQQYAEAKNCFRKAIDLDGFPLRATSVIAEIYHKLSARYQVPLLDARELLLPLSKTTLFGNQLFHDHCHPTLPGHIAIADAVFDSLVESPLWQKNMKQRGLKPSPLRIESSDSRWPSPGHPTSLEAILSHFQLGQEDFIRVCEWEATINGNISYWRYDAVARLNRVQEYRDAVKLLKSGSSPETIRALSLRPLGPDLEQE